MTLNIVSVMVFSAKASTTQLIQLQCSVSRLTSLCILGESVIIESLSIDIMVPKLSTCEKDICVSIFS